MSGSRFLRVLVVLVALLSHFSGQQAKASNINMMGEVQGLRWYLNGNESEPGGLEQTGLNTQVESPIHRLDSVYQSLQPEYGGQANQWVWYSNFYGLKNSALNQNEFQMSFQFNSPAVQVNQYAGLGYSHWEGETALNIGYASLAVNPGRIDYCNAYYNEWVEQENPSRVHWGFSMVCHGDFGPGPSGIAAGDAYFGTPEPGSLALLALGSLAVIRRRL